MNFRYDINGLRAIAVIAVVLFHFNPYWVPGGFAGVDVFFVISGFLMTGIIFRGLDGSEFNLFKFYVARANRIIPALTALCFVLLVFGWFYLTPIDYQVLGKHAASSMSFMSNIIYWTESGYFDAASHEKWLLHTWSLSVEWQFYIIYPVVLLVLNNFLSINNLKRFLLIGIVLSFSFSVFATMKWPNPAYYLLPTRAWEMMFGGVAYIYPWNLQEDKKRLVEYLGLFLILLSYTFISSIVPWPGHFALFPVLGAYLIIVANRQSSKITNNPVFQALGKWSYSIYLWHWPVAVYGYYSVKNWSFIGVPISILLGFLSFRLIESNKFNVYKDWKEIYKVKPILSLIFVFFLCVIIFYNHGFNVEYRFAANTKGAKYIDFYQKINYLNDKVKNEYRLQCDYFDADAYIAKKNEINNACTNGNRDEGVFLWGDSHAQALSYGIRKVFPNIQFNQVATSGCRPHIGGDTKTTGEFKKACDRSNRKAIDTIIKLNPKVVILAQRDEHDQNNFIDILNELRANKVDSKIIVVGPGPQWNPSLPKAIASRHFNPNDNSFVDPYFNKSLLAIDAKMLHDYKGVDLVYISVLNKICKGDVCLAKVDDNNTPIVWDYGHLTLNGSEFIVRNVIAPHLKTYLK